RSIQAGETGVQRLGFRRWVQIEQEARSQAVTSDIEYYRQVWERVTVADICWRPYGNYMVTENIAEELRGVERLRWIAGHRPGEYERIPIDRVRRQFGFVQDIPQAYRPYIRIDAEAAFSPPRPTPPEGPEEIAADRRVMDAGMTKAYRLWWVAELRGVRERHDIAVITAERDRLQRLFQQLQTQVNETKGLVVVAESRAARLEAGVLHARGRIHMLQERLADQWAVPISRGTFEDREARREGSTITIIT
ncbi:hypothetical protein KI387_037902, partial [Taxus chinensis]